MIKHSVNFEAEIRYNYLVPELIFAGFGVLAMILSLVLKYVDKKKGFGLDLPNKRS